MKGLKTTIVGAVIGVLGIAILVLWMLGKLNDDQLTKGLTALGVFGSMVIGFLAKDSNESHTKD